MADVTYIPDQQGQMNNILPWMLAGNNGFGGFGGNGWGGGVLGFVLGLLFGNGWGGFGRHWPHNIRGAIPKHVGA